MELRDIRDEAHVRVEKRTVHHDGHIMTVTEDELILSSTGTRMNREYIVHDDAVGIVALRGETTAEPEVLLISQYRHPTKSVLWEIPAGLLDIPGEDPRVAAARELAEEASMEAERMEFLARFYTSPGCSTELLTVFLATGLSETATDFVREDEEAEIVVRWVPIREVLTAIARGDLTSPTLVIGVLAVATKLRIS